MDIKPFREFWLDCYTSMLYSIYLSNPKVCKSYVYNNFYEYIIRDEEIDGSERKYISLIPMNDISKLEESLLLDAQEIDVWNCADPIESVRRCLLERDVIMLSVDLYEWVDDTYDYQRNHINHFSLVMDIDEELECLVVLETGAKGYKKYCVPFDNAKKAIMLCEESSYAYNINRDIDNFTISKQDIIDNAKHIVSTIEKVLLHVGAVYDISGATDKEMICINDMLQTHLYIMENRQKVNRLLFEIFFDEKNGDFAFSSSFKRLTDEFVKIKGILLKMNCRGQSRKGMETILERLPKLLTKEKDLWEAFIWHSNEIAFIEK